MVLGLGDFLLWGLSQSIGKGAIGLVVLVLLVGAGAGLELELLVLGWGGTCGGRVDVVGGESGGGLGVRRLETVAVGVDVVGGAADGAVGAGVVAVGTFGAADVKRVGTSALDTGSSGPLG